MIISGYRNHVCVLMNKGIIYKRLLRHKIVKLRTRAGYENINNLPGNELLLASSTDVSRGPIISRLSWVLTDLFTYSLSSVHNTSVILSLLRRYTGLFLCNFFVFIMTST